jgi:hypothetical protein
VQRQNAFTRSVVDPFDVEETVVEFREAELPERVESAFGDMDGDETFVAVEDGFGETSGSAELTLQPVGMIFFTIDRTVDVGVPDRSLKLTQTYP